MLSVASAVRRVLLHLADVCCAFWPAGVLCAALRLGLGVRGWRSARRAPVARGGRRDRRARHHAGEADLVEEQAEAVCAEPGAALGEQAALLAHSADVAGGPAAAGPGPKRRASRRRRRPEWARDRR